VSSRAASLSILLSATLWAVNGVIAKALFNRALDPALVVQVRMTLAGLVVLPFALRAGQGHFPLRRWPVVLAYAAALAGVQITYFQAIAVAGVATAIFLQYTAPVLVAAYEALRERRMPSPPLLAALAGAMAGSALLVLGSEAGLAIGSAAVVWGLLASLAMASGTLLGGAAQRQGFGAAPLLAAGLLVGSLAFLPLRSPWAAIGGIERGDWPYLGYIVVFATAVPFFLYVRALARLRGSVAIVLAMLEPALAAVLAWVVLGEKLQPVQIAGALLILGAVAFLALAPEATPARAGAGDVPG
jgi:drug/metabolite transporter (DMT)-like permease